MKINWDTYREVLAGFESQDIQTQISRLVDNYIFANGLDINERSYSVSVSELKRLGILVEDQDPPVRSIVEPFNFMGNDRA